MSKISISKAYNKILSCYLSVRKRKSEDRKLAIKYKNVCGDAICKPVSMEKSKWRNHINKYKIDTRWFDMYHSIWPDSDIDDFLPDSFYYAYLDKHLNDHTKAPIYDDKNFYDLYFPNISLPKTVCRKMNGTYLDSDYKFISKEIAIQYCFENENIILKPSIDSLGGKGLLFWNANNNSIEELIHYFDAHSDFIVQLIIKQHTELSKLHPQSINSIRLLSASSDQGVSVVSTIVRMGVNKSNVDNTSSGGLSCGVNALGRLNNFAYDIKGNRYSEHPQGIHFEESFIPNFEKCMKLVCDLAPRFIGFSKLISWDLAIDQSGNPVLIEVNLYNGGINFHQMNNGPVFKNYIDDFLNITK